MRKKALSWLLAVSMVLSLFAVLPLTANAQTGVCEIIDTNGVDVVKDYDTFGEALTDVAEGQTIRLLTDVTYANTLNVYSKSFNIDVNGFNLTVNPVGAAACIDVGNARELSIIDSKDTGSLTVDVSGGSNLFGLYASGIGSAISVTVPAEITATCDGTGVYAYDFAQITISSAKINVSGSTCTGAQAYRGASITIEGGSVTSTAYGLLAKSDYLLPASSIKFSGDVTATAVGSCGVYANYGSTVELDGSAFATGSDGTAVFAYFGGNVTVSGDAIATGSGSYGASAGGEGIAPSFITIEGSIEAGKYIRIDGQQKNSGQITEPTTKIGYDTYSLSDNSSVVWVKNPNVTYTVTIGTLSGGTITANPTSAASGTTINLTVTPASGKQLKDGTLKYNDGSDRTITGTNFTMPAANVTVTAEFENIPPSGGGGNGGGGGSIPTDTGTKVTVTTIDGKVSVTGTLTQTNSGTQVVIKNSDFNQVNTADKPASVNAQLATVTFDKKAVDVIGTAAGSGDVTLTMRQVPASELSAAQKALVGSRPVYDFTVTGGGKTISDFNGGHATVGLPYNLGAGENPHAIVIWYLSDSGKLVGIRGHYDASTKTVVFRTPHFSSFVVGYNPISFKDVPAGTWYESAVTFLAARDITTGTGEGKFSPDTVLTRGQFIVMLMRAYGIEPDESSADNFTDAGSTYYTNYLAAAKRQGISAGVGNNQFAPDKEITRQEMFTLLYNALKAIGELPAGASGKALTDFSDAPDIASWAKDAMTLLVETGTVSGSGGKLSPTNSTTRSEMAQVLYNLLGK